MSKKTDLHNELKKVLTEEPDNTDKLLKLTQEIAQLDENKVRFSVDAGVIDRLGKELVARHETAVSELIKNAYDADATYVSLNFIDADDFGGTLIITDDGNGMNREQLVNGFMRISSSEKIHTPVSPKFKRKRAGRKGIGRFSAQRLGEKLTIITQSSSSKNAYKVSIDWSSYKMDEDLMLISNSIEEIPREKSIANGTTLIVEDLRDWWSEAMIKRVYRYALDIVQPFPLAKQKLKDGKIEDVGFQISCLKDDVPIANEESMFFEHALAEIEGGITEDGKGFWNIPNSKVDGAVINNPQFFWKNSTEGKTYEFLKGVQLKAYYFVYHIGEIPKQVESYISSISNEQSGIRVYRNGFRVLPYGEPNDDWLELDESVRKRTFLQVHGNHNFFGFVEIDNSNSNFIELSSREGFYHNEAYYELVNFAYIVLTSATHRVASERGVKTKTNQKEWEAKFSRTPQEIVEDAVGLLESVADELEEETKTSSNSTDEEKAKNNRKQQKAKEAREQAEELKKALEQIEELNMLRVLAGLGLVIGEFTHEINQYLPSFAIDTNHLIENLEKGTENYIKAIGMKSRFDSFQVYASYFDETISENVNRELKPIELRDAINPFIKTLNKDLERNNILIETDIIGIDLFTCKMHISEWASILFNLYTNSKKAIKRANPQEKKMLIKAGEIEDKVFVEFLDNGDGIPKENRDKIFNAFFTTSTPKSRTANTNDELTGTGLGLKIIRDIVESYQGEISLENASDGYTTCFRIELPKANKEDIPNDNF